MKTNRKTMKTSAPASAEGQNLFDIRKLVLEGEGQHLEFKRKAAHPEKIVREFIAFANTDGGTLLVGVDDDGSIPGVKYPEEEIHVITSALQQTCRPLLVYQESVLPISENRSVIRYDISPSEKLHFLILGKTRETFVRAEKNLMNYFEQNPQITLSQYIKFSGLNRFRASRKLILLVLANVLKITASEKGDLYSRV
jgi:predicted HTH transcriptional regulator